MSRKAVKLGLLYAVLSVLCSSMYTALGQPLFEVINPTAFVFVENAAALLFILFFSGAVPEYKKIRKLSAEKFSAVFFFAVLASVIAPYLFYLGWSLSTPNNTFLLGKSEMLITVIFAAFFLHEKISWQKISGILIMVLGIFTIASRGLTELTQFHAGDIFLLAGCAVWALANVVYKKYVGKIAWEIVLFLRFSLGTAVFAIVLFFLEVDQKLFVGDFTWNQLWHLVLYILVSAILARYFWMKSVEKAPLVVWSTVSLASPILAIMLNYFFLGEIPEMFHFFGAGLIILGFAFLHIHFHRTKNTHHLEAQRHTLRG